MNKMNTSNQISHIENYANTTIIITTNKKRVGYDHKEDSNHNSNRIHFICNGINGDVDNIMAGIKVMRKKANKRSYE